MIGILSPCLGKTKLKSPLKTHPRRLLDPPSAVATWSASEAERQLFSLLGCRLRASLFQPSMALLANMFSSSTSFAPWVDAAFSPILLFRNHPISLPDKLSHKNGSLNQRVRRKQRSKPPDCFCLNRTCPFRKGICLRNCLVGSLIAPKKLHVEGLTQKAAKLSIPGNQVF